MKPFYAACSQRALHAFSNGTPYEVPGQMWRAAEQVCMSFSPSEQTYLLALYKSETPLAQNVRETASYYHVSREELWQLARRAERRVAVLQGLI